MSRFGFLLVALVAAAGRCAGEAAAARACADPVVCVLEKSPEYDSHEEDMNQAVQLNKELIDAQALEELDDRFYEIIGDDNNCYAVTTVKQPFVIQTNDSLTHNVVQLERFQQKIKWTQCLDNNPEKACFEQVFPRDGGRVRARCAEKYGAVSLYVYDPQERALRYMPFHVPVGCACRFYSSDD